MLQRRRKLHNPDELLKRKRRAWVSLVDIWRKLCSVGLASGLNIVRFTDLTDNPRLRFKLKMAQSCKVDAISPVHGADIVLTCSVG